MTTKTKTKTRRVQSRSLEAQTSVPAARDYMLAQLAAMPPESIRYAWAEHPAEGDKPMHWHIFAQVRGAVRYDWSSLCAAFQQLDAHSHSDKCNSPAVFVRYLRHLDNPEKAQIPESAVHYIGFTESEMAQATAPGTGSCLGVLDALKAMDLRSHPMTVLTELMSAGYKPHEISATVNALTAVTRFRGAALAELDKPLEEWQPPAWEGMSPPEEEVAPPEEVLAWLPCDDDGTPSDVCRRPSRAILVGVR